MHNFIAQLRTRMNEALPGQEAQYKLAPSTRNRPVDPWIIPAGSVTSAVLLLLYPHEDALHLPLMVRTPDHTVHSRQVSLPGGRTEPTDANPIETALREAQEEVGVSPDQIEVLGKLTPLYIPVSNFYVQPVLAFIPHKPQFYPDPKEVDQLLEIPVSFLGDAALLTQKKITVGSGLQMNVPCYEFHGHTVWGATAMILSEFSALL
jgi:8-oxo-dGTP pyrophosphatase MutT (NUDIX family)